MVDHCAEYLASLSTYLHSSDCRFSSTPPYFENKVVISTINLFLVLCINYNKLETELHWNHSLFLILEILSNLQAAGHIVTGDLKIMTDCKQNRTHVILT